jgi:hypothetical protein
MEADKILKLGWLTPQNPFIQCKVCAGYYAAYSVRVTTLHIEGLEIARDSGPYFSKKAFSSFLTRSARSRRVRSGPLKAR